LDDTIAWIIIAVIAGIAAHGTVDLPTVGGSLAGTALFLAASLTIGRRLVARLIAWVNDHMTIEVPVITAILVVMLSMALTTELIGVHTALGAFIAGILIGQSPILTEHIEDELRGFIIAFFSPVFFAVAGLGMDLRTLMDPTLLLFTGGVIVVASVGKFAGALAGGRLGGLTLRESLALATGGLAGRLAGLFTAREKVLATVLEHKPGRVQDPEQAGSREHVAEAARAGAETAPATEQLVLARAAGSEDALKREIARGYDIV